VPVFGQQFPLEPFEHALRCAHQIATSFLPEKRHVVFRDHAANSHFKYLPEFSPANVIDGTLTSASQTATAACWRPNKRTDLWLKIEFGRMVEIEHVTLHLRKLPGQQKTWASATLEFSNAQKVPVQLTNTGAAQKFVFPKQSTAWVKLTDLQDTFPLSDNGVVEMEVYGKDVK
jgi:hypothetical protein